MISKAEIIDKLQGLKPILQTDYSAKEIGLFGSFSDGTFNEDSDIDLIVDFQGVDLYDYADNYFDLK